MKRRDGAYARGDGLCPNQTRGKHDWYTNPMTKQSQPVPRHNEINEQLAKSIIKKLKSQS